jgi:hypothetical protein
VRNTSTVGVEEKSAASPSAAPGFEYRHRPDVELDAAAQRAADGTLGLDHPRRLHGVGMVKISRSVEM